jgi:N-formylglutamate deformylase
MTPYVVQLPNAPRVPILLSIPHCGTKFPEELNDQFHASLISPPDDTDLFVDKLYDFAPALGITVIKSVYSRWIIDLNRGSDDKPLYTDGRMITGLCPTTNFLGVPIYRNNQLEVPQSEIDRRLLKYYKPYHDKLTELLREIKTEFGKVLLWDCHSIRQYVKTIYKENFPDLILGDADGGSASPGMIETAYATLNSSAYSISHNYPFKGGFITRHYGKPLENQQALQLEMSKINYMDDSETEYDPDRADKMRAVLKHTLLSLADLSSTKISR